MNHLYYVGLDVHKKSVSYCVKTADGTIVQRGRVEARRLALEEWARQIPEAWRGALEATLFSGWIYDTLKPYAQELHMANPRQLEAISQAKKKTDAIDAAMLADLLRCNLLPDCYVAPSRVRELRRLLRYRNLMVREAVRMKNRIAGLLMETGTEYDGERLHGKQYFEELLDSLEEMPESVRQLLRLTRSSLETFEFVQKRVLTMLGADAELAQRMKLLQSIPGVGPITALTWALEVGEVTRFTSARQAASYCGLTAAFRSSADKQQRGPISKQRNRHLQSILVEAAKLAPRYHPALAVIYARELERGHRNRATLAVARKLVAYLLAVDRSGQPFSSPGTQPEQPEMAQTA
jgi:transposase